MLLEQISHYRNLHFAIGFSNVAQEAPHYHKEAEISLVLRGYDIRMRGIQKRSGCKASEAA